MLLSGCFLMRRFLTRWVAILSLVFLAGCSSTSLIKTYDGPKVDVSRSAVLSTTGGIEIISVNGQEVKAYLIPELDLNYQILPGQNSVVFTHETLWAKSGKREEGESNSELIVTEPMQMSFNAKAGEVYSFIFGHPESRAEASEFAKTFKATLVDSSEGFVAESTLYADALKTVENKAAAAPVSANAASVGVSSSGTSGYSAPVAAVGVGAAVAVSSASVSDGAVQGGGLPTIDALKVLWDSASTNEKKEFLKWAFK